MPHLPFEVIAMLNKLRTNSILIGYPLGHVSSKKEWNRAVCFWCGKHLVDAEHYLWGCTSHTAVTTRQLLLPQNETDVERFERLPGGDTRAKLAVYKRGILRYELDKCCRFISTMQRAESDQREALAAKLDELDKEIYCTDV